MKVLFLGKSKKNIVFKFLNSSRNLNVYFLSKQIRDKNLNKFKIIISYGYKHIIPKKLITNNIYNLHISYLPFNRGAHPNFWSFIENTPSGVTIHKIDQGIDTGKIIYQKLIDFELFKNKKSLTFANTYNSLKLEIENLFISNFKKIISKDFETQDQIGSGSFHNKKDLPLTILKSWDQNIFKTINIYNKKKKKILKSKMEILDQIEKTRKNNNINWMNILRESIKSSPLNTLDILKSINNDDKKITLLFKKLTK